MGKSSYILIFILAFFMMTCQTSQNLEELKTELHLKVSDENGNLVSGAIVAIFNSDATYDAKSPTYSTEGAIAVDTTSNGISVFTTLNGADNYRISVHYKDETSYPGASIDYDNSTKNNKLPDKLYAGSISEASITLRPANGLVLFWTGTENNEKLPLTINFKTLIKDTVRQTSIKDSVVQTFNIRPSVSESGVTVMKIGNGSYIYTLSSKTGCIYSDTISFTGGELKYVKLEGCNTGRMSFWTGLSLNSSLPITLILNENDTLGVINSVFSITPSDCYANNLLYGDYLPGEYSYTAVSNSSQSVWTGKVNLTKDDCQLIEIK